MRAYLSWKLKRKSLTMVRGSSLEFNKRYTVVVGYVKNLKVPLAGGLGKVQLSKRLECESLEVYYTVLLRLNYLVAADGEERQRVDGAAVELEMDDLGGPASIVGMLLPAEAPF